MAMQQIMGTCEQVPIFPIGALEGANLCTGYRRFLCHNLVMSVNGTQRRGGELHPLGIKSIPPCAALNFASVMDFSLRIISKWLGSDAMRQTTPNYEENAVKTHVFALTLFLVGQLLPPPLFAADWSSVSGAQANTLATAADGGMFRSLPAPDPKFSLAVPPVTGVGRDTTIVSKKVTITGLTKARLISIVGGEYSINGKAFTAQPRFVVNGARLRVRVQSSSAPDTAVTATVTIGAVSVTFVVRTHKITPINDLKQIFTQPPPGATINSDGTVTVNSAIPVKLHAKLPAGAFIHALKGTVLTDNAGTIKFTAKTDDARLSSVDLNAASKGTQVVSGTFSVETTAGNIIPLNNASLTTSDTCPTTMQVQNNGTQTSTFVQDCIVYFNPSGALASANATSATGTAVYGGETAEVGSDGSLERIRIGSLTGDQKLPGDPLVLDGITAEPDGSGDSDDATVPNLNGNLQRLNNKASLLTVIQEALDSKFGVATSQIAYDSASGVVTYTVNGKVYRYIPIDVPSVQVGGTVASLNRFADTNPASAASGAFSLASQGIQVAMAGSLGYFTDLDQAVKTVDQNAKVRLRSSGALQITLSGVDNVCMPGSTAISGGTIQSPSFELDSNGYYAFRDSSGTVQSLYPAFADISVTDQTVKAIDPNGSVSDNGNGTATMLLSGSSFTLRPGYPLIPLPESHANDIWWQDGANIYLPYPDSTAQALSF